MAEKIDIACDTAIMVFDYIDESFEASSLKVNYVAVSRWKLWKKN